MKNIWMIKLITLISILQLSACGGGDDNNTQDNTSRYTITGSVTGLSGSGLVLQNNLTDNLAITSNGNFSFITLITDGSNYSISVLSQPVSPEQTCVINNATGTISLSNISNISVSCTSNSTSPPSAVLDIFQPPFMPQKSATESVSLGDLDADGDLDLVVGNYGQLNQVYLNLGAGDFSGPFEISGKYNTQSVRLGDIDKDGDLDLIAGNSNQANRVYINNGSGSFTDSAQTLGLSDTQSIMFGDVNGDGHLDIVTANSNQANRVYLNNGTGIFTDSTQTLGTNDSRDVALGDIDGDNDLDMVVANYAQPDRVYINNGAGIFTDSTQTLPANDTQSIVLGDIDNDNDLDLIMGNHNQANTVFINNGSGSFTDSGQALNTSLFTTDNAKSLALGDLDGDGDLDLFVGNNNVINYAYFNNGSGVFSNAGPDNGFEKIVDYNTQSIVLGDIDRDGDLDLITGNRDNINRVHLNNSQGNISNASRILAVSRTYALESGDVDGDGDIDLFAANFHTSLLYINDGSAHFTGRNLQNSDPTGKTCIAVGDLDGDGDLDVVEGDNTISPNKIYLNNGSGNFTSNGQSLGNSDTESIALGDLDNDGDLDLVVGNSNTEANQIYFNDGAANFSDSLQALGNARTESLALGDIDGDGDLDIVAGNNGYAPSRVYYNDGNGNFTDSTQELGWGDAITTYDYTEAVLLGDLDGDGDLDLVAANKGGLAKTDSRIYYNNGTGIFSDSLQRMGDQFTSSAALGDIDGDGDLDLVFGDISPFGNRLFLNDGTGVFSNDEQRLGVDDTFDLVLADFDSDGDLDLASGEYDNDIGVPDLIYMNNTN